ETGLRLPLHRVARLRRADGSGNAERHRRVLAAREACPPRAHEARGSICDRSPPSGAGGRTIVVMADQVKTAEAGGAAKGASMCQVVHDETVGEVHLTQENVERLLATGTFVWIDVHRPTAADFTVLRDVFHFHPLALEDSETFGQRAKIDDYDDF